MGVNADEVFKKYVWAGAMTRNADALAEMFTEDGVLEAPLMPAGGSFPRRLAGREAIREGLHAYYARSTGDARKVNPEKSGYVLHTTADRDVFIAEIDTVFDGPGGPSSMSLVQIFRLRDGKLAMVRDYFAPTDLE